MGVTAVWSLTPRSGVTTVACSLALLAARSKGAALLVDLTGGVDLALELVNPEKDKAVPGLSDWFMAKPAGQHRLELGDDGAASLTWPSLSHMGPGWTGPVLRCGAVSVVPRGPVPLRDQEQARTLARILGEDQRPVVVDCGWLGQEGLDAAVMTPGHVLVRRCTTSVWVTRGDELALERATRRLLKVTCAVLMHERGNGLLDGEELRQRTEIPVIAEVPHDRTVARAASEGRLGPELPATLARALGSSTLSVLAAG